MNPVVASLVAVFAKRYAKKMIALLDVVRVTGWGCVTQATGQRFDGGKVFALMGLNVFGVQISAPATMA